jgi:hypothetical protein
MNWKIRFRANKSDDSPITTIQVNASHLRDACAQVMSLYRKATILDYQEGDGEVKSFNVSSVRFQCSPIDPNQFSAAKQFSS